MIRSVLLSTLFSLIFASTAATAATLTIGTQTNYNNFPFASARPNFDRRYQQVWDASSFAGLGPIQITALELQKDTSVFSKWNPFATFVFSFSTTPLSVNGLNPDRSNAGLLSNIGPDNTFFNQTTFAGGLASPVLNFGGLFDYDSSQGNLLLDIQTSATQYGGGFGVAATSTSGGLFSRSHNIGSGFDNYGFIATFEYDISPIPLPASLPLFAIGLAAFGFLRHRASSIGRRNGSLGA